MRNKKRPARATTTPRESRPTTKRTGLIIAHKRITFTDRFWDMIWPVLAILDAVLAYTLIQIARGVL